MDFDLLDQVLAAQRWLWQPAPFRDTDIPWLQTHADMGQALESLSDADYHALRHDDTQARQFLAHWVPELAQLNAFREPDPQPLPEDFREPAHVPGRKARQVACFCAHLPQASGRVVEWCAGQGWLLEAALTRQPHRAGLGLEYQPRLCAQGNLRLAARGLNAELTVTDVMDNGALPPLGSDDTVLALHACGHLHQRLLEQAGETPLGHLLLSPCCYHLGEPRALSHQGRRARLDVRLIDRHLAVQDITTGHSNRSKRNEKASRWRLGYDALRRSLTGDTHYRPMRSLPGSVWQGEFSDFAALAAEHHGLALPAQVDWAHWLEAGERLHARTRRLELPRRQYRRLLEWWLVEDGAASLREAGYTVTTGTFCAHQDTPRNLLITAWRDKP